MESPTRSPSRKGHGRSRSAGVLKSIVKPASRNASPKKRAAFAGDGLESNLTQRLKLFSDKDQRHPSPRVLGEVPNGNQSASPKRHAPGQQRPQSVGIWDGHSGFFSPTSGQVLLSPPSKRLFLPKEKENTTPPSASGTPRPSSIDTSSPIWAQFTSRPDQELARLREQRLGTRTNTKQEIEKYAPPALGPTSHRVPARPTSQVFEKGLPSAPLTTNKSPEKLSTRHARQESAPAAAPGAPPKKSKVLAAIAKFQGTGSEAATEGSPAAPDSSELDEAFEQVLVSRNIPEHRRRNMRTLDDKIKREFIRNHKPEPATVNAENKQSQTKSIFKALKPSKDDMRGRSGPELEPGADEECDSSNKRSRSRSGTFTWGKRSRSGSRTRGLMSLKNLSSSSVNSITGSSKKETQEKTVPAGPSTSPGEFVAYLKSQTTPEKVEVGRLHKLRLLIRNESISWVASFVEFDGLEALVDLLGKIMTVEWREEHEDLLLHEVLLCMKGLCTSQHALRRLDMVGGSLFPKLVDMIFDEERKGPAEFNTRGVITTLLFEHLRTASQAQRVSRAREVLLYLADRKPVEEKRPATFIVQMQQNRPYQAWAREVSSVTKEVFWIFLHHLNAMEPAQVDMYKVNESFYERHFPKERPPIPAAPYMGGVEWDATNYLASHLDLMNGLIASLPTSAERNALREELRSSGMEKIMGDKLRLCKEKFYGCVHDGLRTWIAAAMEDGWETHDVCFGPPKRADSPVKDNNKGKPSQAPQLELPKLDLGGGGHVGEAWL